MRFFLFRAAALAAAASLVLFGSCERHSPDELHHGSHAPGEHAEHTDHAAPGEPGHDKASHDGHDHAHPATPPAGTPAEFFPSPTPTPQ